MAPLRALVGIDLPAVPADLDAVAATALVSGWDVVLVHVVEPVHPLSFGSAGEENPDPDADPRPRETELADAAQALSDRGLTVVTQEVVFGAAVEELLKASQAHECEVISLVARTHDAEHRTVLGSVLSSLLKTADVPVLVLPDPQRVKAGAAAVDQLFDAAERAGTDVDLDAVRQAAAAHRADPEDEEASHRLRGAIVEVQTDHPALTRAINNVGYYLSGLGM